MDVFELRRQLIEDYHAFLTSFFRVADDRVRAHVEERLAAGLLWPDPLVQLNPSFEPGETIDQLVAEGVLHPECARIFRLDKAAPGGQGRPLRLHRHQAEAVRTGRTGRSYVLTTGTGSGKSLAYVIPIVDHVLRQGAGRGIQAIVVYPMNALANSQHGELGKFLGDGYPDRRGPVRFAQYTGQEGDAERQAIIADPPDILLTNYVMLELLLTRPREAALVRGARGLRFMVLDELHTYRGRQGADVAFLVRRARELFEAFALQCVGTSATLGGTGTSEERRAEVARVASMLFGTPVRPEDVIAETLRRATPEPAPGDPAFAAALRAAVADPYLEPPTDHAGLIAHPLSSWIESAFGVEREAGTGRLVRSRPRSLGGEGGAAHELSMATGLDEERCAAAIQRWLLGAYRAERDPVTGFPAFAFRLHQFISRGHTVWASLEPETERHLTVFAQQFVPGDRDRVLLPLAFCRECGQEYYAVSRRGDGPAAVYEARDISDPYDRADGEPGYLYLSMASPWPEDVAAQLDRLPEDWLEEVRGQRRVRAARREMLPRLVRLAPDGRWRDDGLPVHWVPSPFRFCLRCGVSYGTRITSDLTKLAVIGSGGRSTATTTLGLSAIRQLRRDETLPERARKLLSFTDNRQDASLQAGHFNDFVEVGILRAALYRACVAAGPDGLSHDVLKQRVFDALALPFETYAVDATWRFQARAETERTLRDVLGYRLYRDLRRGWRIMSPNLEQCGLLEIEYASLDELCAAEDVWQGHPALAGAPPDTRRHVARALLDHMRRDLAIRVDVLDRETWEQIQQRSQQRLIAPWGLDENELPELATVVYPRARRDGDVSGMVCLSPRGLFGQFLRRVFRARRVDLSLDETELVLRQLLRALREAGLVEPVEAPDDPAPGYQVPAAALRWHAGDGTAAFHDPIRVPNPPPGGGRTNPFFVRFYRTTVNELHGLEAREHTAQVPYHSRREREERFRAAALPILFCSPTMELGVDIAELNVVNLRNVPPTPANYAQRSGRAGRSGQPALVFTYCAAGSSHDQYFFNRPEQMVAGMVMPPRLDLLNEDLVRAHVYAIWLAVSGRDLGRSLTDILDVTGDPPTLALLPSVRADLEDEGARRRARARAAHVLDALRTELAATDWWTDTWLDETLAQLPLAFERACERWRSLYRAALAQRERQHRIILDHSRPPAQRLQAQRLRQEAETQIDLLTRAENIAQSDFYSYRYFASEGFLPGYSFPRLPLSAYIPARRTRTGRDEFLTRPRFLAISEFGPRAIVYHEGSRYLIHKVILPVPDQPNEEPVVTVSAKRCAGCGYMHPCEGDPGPDLCQGCGAALPPAMTRLFRLQNVSTRRRDKINCDEEERLRLGYDVRSGIRFAEHGGVPACRTAVVTSAEGELARLAYGGAATLWRINLGWRAATRQGRQGFVLDVERGFWARNQQDPEDEEDGLGPRVATVIPFVEDRRNCLLVTPAAALDAGVMASLQAALKTAIQVRYQLEDAELAAEALPDPDTRRTLLLYESAEGGAGVLRRLVEDPHALGEVAREALRLCHFDPDTGADLGRSPRSPEPCEAACYDCLMSYTNQLDHRVLDRQRVRPLLLALSRATVTVSPGPRSRAEHLAALRRQAGSALERRWLDELDARGHRLPTHAQPLLDGTRPDFLYEAEHVAVYVDGPPHDYPERRARDAAQQARLEDAGYLVIRFAADGDWAATLARYPNVFGPGGIGR
ncbi:MAG TPA: DEAD/DEAH box helicase [Methylomirabilota bacterium]|nr:DEAD/DEAH box helicase [Methylomirabilota bacterium]